MKAREPASLDLYAPCVLNSQGDVSTFQCKISCGDTKRVYIKMKIARKLCENSVKEKCGVCK